jgi:hypothetical protein
VTHPFVSAWEHRDRARWRDDLAPDVVLHSPVLTKPFHGRDAVAGLYRVLFEEFGDVVITDRLESGDTTAFHWGAKVHGRDVEGLDLVRLDGAGKVAEIRVFMRPLTGLGAFVGGVAPAVARPRGRRAAAAARAMTLPVRPLFRVIDVAATRMSQRGDA